MKTLAGNLLLLLLSTLFALLLLEQGFRVWLFGWQAFDSAALRNNVPVNNAGIMQQSAFDDIYWELKPNLDVSFKLAHLTTNSHGLADREYPLHKPVGTYRIAVLGDSYSMASGVDTDKNYHALLEKQLSASTGRPYEFINFAVGGFGLERYNATLEHKVPAWQPDAILLGYCGFNDHFALPPPTGAVPPFNPPRIDGFRLSYVMEYIRLREAEKRAREDTTGMVLSDKHLAFIDRELARTRELADRIKPGMPILFAYLDNRAHSEQDLQAIAAIAQRHGMAFVDTSRQFAGTRIDDYSIQLLDSHPNAPAHALFAATLLDAIRSQQLFGSQGDRR